MVLRNFDSSRVTQKLQNKVLYGFYSNNVKNNNTGNVRTEQPTLQSGYIVVDRQQGACSCANDRLASYNVPATGNTNPAFINPVTNGAANNA